MRFLLVSVFENSLRNIFGDVMEWGSWVSEGVESFELGVAAEVARRMQGGGLAVYKITEVCYNFGEFVNY